MSNKLNGEVCSFSTRILKVTLALLIAICALLFVPSSRADNLQFFKNYFVTGDYTVAGVGLYGQGKSGTATGKISMTTVPQGADIVAAFLYWQTVETTAAPSSINGIFDGNAIVGDAIGSPATPACWTPAGSTGPTGSAVRVYRADVLRYLTINTTSNIRVANGTHTIQLPDSGNTAITVAPHTYGATLVVVYRQLQVGAAPYKAVVIYNGASTMTRKTPAFAQVMGGFYQSNGLGERMTQIVGNGQAANNVELTVNGSTPFGVNDNIFDGNTGSHWDNPTFAINLAPNASSVQTQTIAETNSVCLSWAAVITSTNVIDTDGDGLLDTWETNGLHLNPGTSTIAATFGGCKDYPSDPCENLPAMGAVNGIRDIFVQIDWMQGTDGHIHVPKLSGLQAIASVFSTHKINVHFDVGKTHYQTSKLPYIVPAAYATGGNVIQESALGCPNSKVTSVANCDFPNLPYSALGWKKGFEAIKEGFPILNIPQYFAHDRKDIFHYILFGHALAGPFNTAGMPLVQGEAPSSVSGVADTPGGDLLVTLGLWRADNAANCVQDDPTGANANICTDQTGSWLIQAGTVMHELGHNLGLYHGGSVNVPNCMPDYPSVMNYLYQTRGLTDAAGNEHIDFSNGLLGPLNENALYEKLPMGILSYRVRYYASPNSTQTGSAAKAHCDGSPVTGAPEVRLETSGLATPDWNNNGKVDAGSVSADINFNGTTGDVVADSVEPADRFPNDPFKLWFIDHNDWATLNLQQIGGRSNTNGLSDDISAPDLGQSDLGQSDLGQSDLGQSDLGQSDLGQSDLGQSDLGQSDLGEMNFDTAISSLDATSASNPLVATVSASNPANIANTGYNQITLTWGLPSLGQMRTYNIYRTNLTATTPTTVLAGTVSGAPPTTTFIDVVNDTSAAHSGKSCPPTVMCYDANYQYYIVGTDVNGTPSTPSNTVTGTVNHLFVTAYSGSVLYGNTLPSFSSTAATITGLVSGALPTASFSCTNTTGSVPPRNVMTGGYTITCTGPLAIGTGTTDGVTYIPGTLTINARPLTISAITNTKVYDGTVTANATPVVTAPVANVSGLAYTDTVNGQLEIYNNPNAGTGKTLMVSTYTINDGNSGKNYTVSTPTNATGVITQRPLTINAVANSKIYDGNTSSATLPAIVLPTSNTGLVLTDFVSNLTETYDTRNVGTGKTLSVATYLVNDGNMGLNYIVTKVTSTAGVITQRSLTIAAQPATKIYDGNTSSSTAPMVVATTSTTGLVGGDSVGGSLIQTYAGANAGNETLSVSAGFTVVDGNMGNNYIVSLTTASGVISKRQLIISAQAFNKIYDSTTSASAIPVVSNPTATTGLVAGDSLSGSLMEAYVNANAGSETLFVSPTFTVIDGNMGNNYAVTLNTAYGVISQRQLIIDAQPNTKTYDGTASATTPPSVEALTSTTGLEASDAISNLSEVYGSPNVGNETLSVSPTYIIVDENMGNNYAVTTNTAVGMITPASLKASVNATVKPTLSSNQPLTLTLNSYTLSGFVNEEPNTVVTGTLACALDATHDTGGKYPVSCLGLSAANYNISYDYTPSPKLFAFTPAPLVVNVSGSTQLVDTTPTFTISSYTFSGFINTDSASIVNGTLACTAGPTADAAGNYPITCSGLGLANYSITYSYSVTSAINPTPLTVAVNGTSATIPGTPQYTITYSGFVSGDTLSVVTGTLSCVVSPSPDDTGNYPIMSCSGLSAPSKYIITYWLGEVVLPIS